MTKSFNILCLGAFLLEAAGYIAFPYLSQLLRDRHHFTEAEIGTVLLVAIWIRPVSALLGGLLAEKIKIYSLFVVSCLLEALCFVLLGLASLPAVAILAVILGNIGFALWTPNLVALVFRLFPKEEATKHVSFLTGILNAGAAFGCFIGAIGSGWDLRYSFIAAGATYFLTIPLLRPAFSWENSPSTKNQKEDTVSSPHQKTSYLPIGLALLITLGYWATYSQFNSFHSLYSKDWLKMEWVTGISFGIVSIVVAITSVWISKNQKVIRALPFYCLLSAILLGVSWNLIAFYPNLAIVFLFLIFISISESFFSVFLADYWARMNPARPHFMQSAYFTSRSIAMGLGSFLGGLTYKPPLLGNTLSSWATGISVTLALSVFALLIQLNISRSRNDTFTTH